jgi:hypothetical protein
MHSADERLDPFALFDAARAQLESMQIDEGSLWILAIALVAPLIAWTWWRSRKLW